MQHLEIMVTSTKDYQQEAIKAGADGFIQKKDREALYRWFATLGDRTVAFVENDPVTSMFLPQILSNHAPNAQSNSFTSAEELIAAIEKGSVPELNAVLTDVNLDGMSGLALVATLREMFPEEQPPQA